MLSTQLTIYYPLSAKEDKILEVSKRGVGSNNFARLFVFWPPRGCFGRKSRGEGEEGAREKRKVRRGDRITMVTSAEVSARAVAGTMACRMPSPRRRRGERKSRTSPLTCCRSSTIGGGREQARRWGAVPHAGARCSLRCMRTGAWTQVTTSSLPLHHSGTRRHVRGLVVPCAGRLLRAPSRQSRRQGEAPPPRVSAPAAQRKPTACSMGTLSRIDVCHCRRVRLTSSA